MIPLRFHPEADVEMMEAAVFYENEQLDLGKRFLSTVQHSLGLIQINPTLYPCIHNDVRRCLTKTFPFNVLYRIVSGQFIVVAVMHQSKDPDYWKGR